MRFIILCICLCFFSSFLPAQEIKIYVAYQDKENDFQLLNTKDSLTAVSKVNTIVRKKIGQGYYTASIDNVERKNDSLIFYVYEGNRFKLDVNKVYLLKDSSTTIIEYNYKNAKKLANEWSNKYLDNGYPFVTLQFDSLKSYKKNKIQSSLIIEPGIYTIFDTLVLTNDSLLKHKFVQRYIGYKKGEPFSLKKIVNAERYLRQLPAVKLLNEPVVDFHLGEYNLFIEYQKARSNRFDGIVGFLPDPLNNNRIQFTGEADMKFNNLFRSAKELDFKWRSFAQASQSLDVAYKHPMLLGSPIYANLKMNLFKQDSSFFTVMRMLDLSIRTASSGLIGVYTMFKRSETSLAMTPSNVLRNGNYEYIQYGLSYDWNNYDDQLFPTSGAEVKLRSGLGNKKILRSEQTLAPFIQYEWEVSANKIIPFRKNKALVNSIHTGQVFANGVLFQNDFQRIGGVNSLRGFNENEFFAADYVVVSSEIRFLANRYNYLLFSLQQAYLYNPVTSQTEYPTGMGLGLNISTAQGSFYFIYSLGRSTEQQISLNLSKIHFGLITNF